MRVGRIVIALGIVVAAGAALTFWRQPEESARITTGKFITPVGDQIDVGSSPVNMKLSPDGRFVAVSDCGFREQLSIVDAHSGRLLSKRVFEGERGDPSGIYYGLAFAKSGDRTLLYVSRGAQDLVSVYEVREDGTTNRISDINDAGPENPANLPHHVAGLAVSPDGQTVYAVNNQTHPYNGMHGSVSAFSADGKRLKEYPVGGYQMDAATTGQKLFVSNERDGTVTAIDLATGTSATIITGAGPVGLLLNRDGTRLYVSNSCSDTVSVVDTASNRVLRTILIRIGDLKGLPGATPLGAALSSDERTLYVALADANAVAVVDLPNGGLKGFIPAGWGPTDVVLADGGSKLFVSNAKGAQAKTPNNKAVRD